MSIFSIVLLILFIILTLIVFIVNFGIEAIINALSIIIYTIFGLIVLVLIGIAIFFIIYVMDNGGFIVFFSNLLENLPLLIIGLVFLGGWIALAVGIFTFGFSICTYALIGIAAFGIWLLDVVRKLMGFLAILIKKIRSKISEINNNKNSKVTNFCKNISDGSLKLFERIGNIKLPVMIVLIIICAILFMIIGKIKGMYTPLDTIIALKNGGYDLYNHVVDVLYSIPYFKIKENINNLNDFKELVFCLIICAIYYAYLYVATAYIFVKSIVCAFKEVYNITTTI